MAVETFRFGELYVRWLVPWGSPHTDNLIGENDRMNGIVYLVGLVVVIMAVLSFFGLR